jgi:excisionase family DNA binding protein
MPTREECLQAAVDKFAIAVMHIARDHLDAGDLRDALVQDSCAIEVDEVRPRPVAPVVEFERAVTVKEMAEILSLTLETVYRKSRSGEIPGVRIGRSWRYYPSVVQAFLNKPKDPWKLSNGSLSRLNQSR